MFIYSIYACFIGFILDMIFGDPYFLFHPIRVMGKMIQVLEKVFRKVFSSSSKGIMLAGVFFNVSVCVISVFTAFIIILWGYRLNVYFGVAVESVTCYFMIAAKSLKKESMKVYKKIT